MVEQIAPELVERCVTLVRKVATWTWVAHSSAAEDYAEARDIVSLLPKPIDPDLIEARKIVNRHARTANGDWANNFLSGDADNTYPVQAALAAIKYGKTLARTDQETAHVR